MARTLRAAVRSGVCFTRALAVFAEITDDLRDHLHSALASREAMSAVPEICRRDCAEIPGAHQRIKSANFADLVSDLKRLGSAQGPLLSDESMQAECKAQEQKGS